MNASIWSRRASCPDGSSFENSRYVFGRPSSDCDHQYQSSQPLPDIAPPIAQSQRNPGRPHARCASIGRAGPMSAPSLRTASARPRRRRSVARALLAAVAVAACVACTDAVGGPATDPAPSPASSIAVARTQQQLAAVVAGNRRELPRGAHGHGSRGCAHPGVGGGAAAAAAAVASASIRAFSADPHAAPRGRAGPRRGGRGSAGVIVARTVEYARPRTRLLGHPEEGVDQRPRLPRTRSRRRWLGLRELRLTSDGAGAAPSVRIGEQ